MSLRQEVLVLYRKFIRLSFKWTSSKNSVAETEVERKYIRDEARLLFRKNKGITDETEIREHIREGEARYEIALHYKTPYPRPLVMAGKPDKCKCEAIRKQQILDCLKLKGAADDNIEIDAKEFKVHAPQHVLHTTVSKRLKTQKRKFKQSKPLYMKSYDDDKS